MTHTDVQLMITIITIIMVMTTIRMLVDKVPLHIQYLVIVLGSILGFIQALIYGLFFTFAGLIF